VDAIASSGTRHRHANMPDGGAVRRPAESIVGNVVVLIEPISIEASRDN